MSDSISISASGTYTIKSPNESLVVDVPASLTGNISVEIKNPSNYQYTLSLSTDPDQLYGGYYSDSDTTVISTDLAQDSSANPKVYISLDNSGNFLNLPKTLGGEAQVTSLKTDSFSVACFLAGCQVEMASGSVAVENISVGDSVITYVKGKKELQPVVWAGKSSLRVKKDLPDDLAGYPVRIVQGALASAVPSRDMLVTADHCLFLGGKFVPVRMLVNNKSIFYDKSYSSYDYYHIETAQHAVIKVDNMLTESYLDTGNRRNFVTGKNVVLFRSQPKSWSLDAGAPLETGREFVEPLFHSIMARSDLASGQSEPQSQYHFTTDHELYLEAKNGRKIYPVKTVGNNVSFLVPMTVQSLEIVSRSSRPFDVIGPFVDDRRNLGVLVGSIVVCHADRITNVTTHLSQEPLSGWHDLETNCRWTDGRACLPLAVHAEEGWTMLTLEILAAGPYAIGQSAGVSLSRLA